MTSNYMIDTSNGSSSSVSWDQNSGPSPDIIPSKVIEVAIKSLISPLDLPYDILTLILKLIPPYELPQLRRVCRGFNELLTSEHVLEPLLRRHFPCHVRSSLSSVQKNKNVVESAKGLDPVWPFDSALKRLMNRTRGKPTSITCISGVRPDASYETETSYDHMFLVFHHISGHVFIYDSGNRFPETPYVTLDIHKLAPPWHGIKVPGRYVRQSVVLDKRILVISGTKEYENYRGEKIPHAVYSLHNYPHVEFLGIWRGEAWKDRLSGLCANDEWIACKVKGHFLKLIRISSLYPNEQMEYGQIIQMPSPDPLEITRAHPQQGNIKDVHLTKNHIFTYSTITEEHGNHGQIDVFRIETILDDRFEKPTYEINHVRSVMLHNWERMFLDYIGYSPSEDIPDAMRCARWDKIYPYMRGSRHDGMPEEDEHSIMMTLGKTFRVNGNVPIGCVRIHAEPEVVRVGQPILETISPQSIIPFCIALDNEIQAGDADHTMLVPHSDNTTLMQEAAESESENDEFEPSPFDPDVPAPPDDIEMTTGDSQDPQPGDDAALDPYLIHFGESAAEAPVTRRLEATLPTPSVKEAWFLEQDQTQRTSVVTDAGLFHVFYSELSAEEAALNPIVANNQNIREPTILIPSHMQHIPLEDIFDEKIPFYDYPKKKAPESEATGAAITAEGITTEGVTIESVATENLAAENLATEKLTSEVAADVAAKEAHRERLQKLIQSVKSGWSCYVWSADTWNGFLITNPQNAEMIILRYD